MPARRPRRPAAACLHQQRGCPRTRGPGAQPAHTLPRWHPLFCAAWRRTAACCLTRRFSRCSRTARQTSSPWLARRCPRRLRCAGAQGQLLLAGNPPSAPCAGGAPSRARAAARGASRRWARWLARRVQGRGCSDGPPRARRSPPRGPQAYGALLQASGGVLKSREELQAVIAELKVRGSGAAARRRAARRCRTKLKTLRRRHTSLA